MENKVKNNWTNIMKAMDIGQSIHEVPSDFYGSLCTTRTRLKMKSVHKGWHWSLTLGKGLITIKRTK